jgi:HEAT repeat protein
MIADYLRRFREGDAEDAFHGLLEMDHAILPELIAAFRGEADGEVRRFLVEVIWQHRQPSAIPFLGEVLRDPDPQVWKEALDGLVALASPAAIEALRAARGRTFPSKRQIEEFRGWLEEALEQAGSRKKDVSP